MKKFDILEYMKFMRIIASFFVIATLFFQIGIAFASNISPTAKYSQFLNIDLDTDTVNDRINWRPSTSGTGATVTDTAITGTIWGESVGWINLNPTNGGVENTCDGDLSGYAWGQNTGWINFSPTNGGVTINTTTGEFDGHAWAQNYGWINFDCSDSNACVTTTWDGCVTDVCPNIDGDQSIVPSGYELDGGLCVKEEDCPGGVCGADPSSCNLYADTPIIYPGDTLTLTWDTTIGDGNYTSAIVAGRIIDGNTTNSLVLSPTATTDYQAFFSGNFANGIAQCSTPTVVYDHCPNLDGVQLYGESCQVEDFNYCTNRPEMYVGTWPTLDPNNYVTSSGACLTYEEGFCINKPGVTFQSWIAQDSKNYITENQICLSQNEDQEMCPSKPGITKSNWIQQDPYFNYVNSSGECVSYEETKVCFNLFEGGLDSIPDGYRGTDENDRTCVIDDTDQTILGFLEKDLFGKLAPIIGIIGLLSTIPGFATRILNLILSIPFYRRRRPWGIVYDSQTKETLDPAYVTVYNADTNQLVDTRITDINGRYGFLLPKGNYRIEAQKTHYIFPSVLLPRQSSDGVYDNLYFGEVFSVTDENKNAVITLNIPMDRLATDWNQEEKKRLGIMRMFTHNTKLWSTVSLILFIAGFIFSAFVLIIDQSTWNIIVFCLYVLFTVLQLVGYGPVRSGFVTDKIGNPIAHAVVRVWNAHLGTEIAKRITDEKGQYYLLIARGDYYVTIDVKNSSGGYDRVLTSETIRAMQGVINESYKI